MTGTPGRELPPDTHKLSFFLFLLAAFALSLDGRAVALPKGLEFCALLTAAEF